MLKIDLLPRHFAIARKNKALLGIFVVLLILTAAVWMFQAKTLTARIEKVTADDEALQPTITKVDQLTKDTEAKKGELQPIKAKVDFANEADKSGRGFWKAYHAVNEYIWADAQVTNMSIQPPGSVTFTAKVKGTAGAGRFLMNLLRCPALTNITMNGLPAGQTVAGGGGGGAVPGGMPGPMGGAPMPGAPPMAPGAPPMMPGAPPGPPGAPGAPGMAGMPGMPGAPGAAPAGRGAPGSPEEELTFTVTAQLTSEYTITIPSPAGAAPAAGAGMPGMPGGGPPGAMAPPGGGAGPPGAAGGGGAAPSAGKKGAAGEDDSSGGGGGGKLGKKGGAEEGI